MKRNHWIGLIALAILVSLCLAACGSAPAETKPADTEPAETEPIYVEMTVTVDENGLVSWEPVPHAVAYRYHYVEGLLGTVYTSTTTETTLPLYDGYSLILQPLLADGREGLEYQTAVYGDPSKYDETRVGMVETDFSTTWQELSRLDVIKGMDRTTLVAHEDGTVTFMAVAEDGTEIRFVGTGITVTDTSIFFEPHGSLVGLDAIGRICAYSFTFAPYEGDHSVGLDLGGGYSFSKNKLHVSSKEDLMLWSLTGMTYQTGVDTNSTIIARVMNHQPNFVLVSGDGYITETTEVSELIVHYDTKTFVTDIRALSFDTEFYTAYLEGERYDASREVFDPSTNRLSFYLIAVPHVLDRMEEVTPEEARVDTRRSLYGLDVELLTVGELLDADGNAVDKKTHPITGGETLSITVGDYAFDVELSVTPIHKEAETMSDLVPYAYPEATGTINTLVIPIVWQDEPEDASSEMLALYRSELGRILHADGSVTDDSDLLSDPTRFSLSRYYDIASYGKLTVQSFLTDWYYAPYDFSEMQYGTPDEKFLSDVLAWFYNTYPTLDYTQFDKDGNGYFDSVIFLNAGDLTDDSYYIISFSGGIMTRSTYTGELAGTPDKPTFNCYTVMNTHLLDDNTLIHEFAHNLGLVDYYDVTYSGIDAIGRFDMQSSSVGDWNAYSKYAVGWITPKVVAELASGESVEITIGALATTGDAILIPGAESLYFGTPFSEYILIDLYTDGGVNEYDAAEAGFDLADSVGVRIYHVNALMEYRALSVEGQDTLYPIGTIHTANTYSESGRYHLELIQAGGENTFTNLNNLRTALSGEDLFGAGDVFDAAEYTEFFTDGQMDDGTDFGYTVEILSVTKGDAPTATLRITRK